MFLKEELKFYRLSGVDSKTVLFLFQTELAEQKKLSEDYRTQLLAMESEMDYLRDQVFDL